MNDLTSRRIDAARRAYYLTRQPISTSSPREDTAWAAALDAPDVDTALHALIVGLYGDAVWADHASDHIHHLRREAMTRARTAADAIR